MRRRKRRDGVSLPWERRGNWLRRVLAGPRWKILVALLALVLASVSFWDAAERRRQERTTYNAISEVQRAMSQFRTEVGRCPRSTVELVHPPRTSTRYLRDMPKDGWGRDLWVRCPGYLDADDADVISAGPSGDFFLDDNLQ